MERPEATSRTSSNKAPRTNRCKLSLRPFLPRTTSASSWYRASSVSRLSNSLSRSFSLRITPFAPSSPSFRRSRSAVSSSAREFRIVDRGFETDQVRSFDVAGGLDRGIQS